MYDEKGELIQKLMFLCIKYLDLFNAFIFIVLIIVVKNRYRKYSY